MAPRIYSTHFERKKIYSKVNNTILYTVLNDCLWRYTTFPKTRFSNRYDYIVEINSRNVNPLKPLERKFGSPICYFVEWLTITMSTDEAAKAIHIMCVDCKVMYFSFHLSMLSLSQIFQIYLILRIEFAMYFCLVNLNGGHMILCWLCFL